MNQTNFCHIFKVMVTITFLCLTMSSSAQTYPNKPIKFYLPNGPGGIGDLITRVVTQKVSEKIGQQILVENRPSAAGVQAFTSVQQAPADGYALALIGNGSAISYNLVKNLPFNVKTDFEAVTTMARFSIVLLVNQNSKFSSVKDVIEFSKKNPGQMNFGAINVGSTQYLGAELFKQLAGIHEQTIPFNSTASVMTALKSGDIDVAFEFVGPVFTSITSGSIRCLGVGANQRLFNLPNVPTVSEAGLPGYEVSSWNGVFVKAGTPKPIIAKLYKEFNEAMASPQVIQSIKNMNADPFSLTTEETQALLFSDIKKWQTVIQNAHIALN
jgi:tripartite-type tricarboxylate transporter receptor subunit TctC